MGVHYFYTWLTTRYPMIRQVHNHFNFPIIDYLYLDLNGVFYKCSQDEKGVFRERFNGKTQEEILGDILNYINFLVKVIKPRKQVFLAVDGVAPRAKMKDQRNRRYVKQREREVEQDFLENYLGVTRERFTQREISISTGSSFMESIDEHLDFFVKRKLHEDPLWKDLQVVFSPGTVPGEGEHKIMDFIRKWKKGPDFDSSATHCIYGNDSDLLVLALITHLPHVLVLRECFPPLRHRVISEAMDRADESQKMEVIYINILKEYLALEFQKCLGPLFEIERLVNDFVLFSFLVGNDFLPQIFCMNTKMGIYDKFLKVLRLFYRRRGTYLTTRHKISQESLLHLFKYLRQMEEQLIETTLGDFLKKSKELRQHPAYKAVVLKTPFNPRSHEESLLPDTQFQTLADFEEFLRREQEELEIEEQELTKIDIAQLQDNQPDDGEVPAPPAQKSLHLFEQEFVDNYCKVQRAKNFLKKLLLVKRSGQNFKKLYYRKYFGSDQVDFKTCYDYLKGLTFVFQYYQVGCPSWSFLYTHSLPPLLSDLHLYLQRLQENGAQLHFDFPFVGPTTALAQQLTILPKKALQKLPPRLAEALLSDPALRLFYPDSFEVHPTDRSKEYTWHAQLPEIRPEELDRFVAEFDWASLPEAALRLNRLGAVRTYVRDSSCSLRVAPLLAPFQETQAQVRVTESRPEYEVDVEAKVPLVSGPQKSLFPSSRVFKQVSLRKELKRGREIVYFLLSNQAVKSYWEKIHQGFKQMKLSKAQFPYRLFANAVFSKLFLSYQIDLLEQDRPQDQAELQKLLPVLVQGCLDMGLQLEDPSFLHRLKNVPVFHVDKPVFANISYNLGDPKVHIKTIEDKSEKKTLFLGLSLKQPYPSTFGYPRRCDVHFRDDSLCLNLETGDLVHLQKLAWNSSQQEGSLLRANKTSRNQ